MDKNGYVIGGLSFLLIVPSVLLLMVLIDMVNLDDSSNTMFKSDSTFYIVGDVEGNIPSMTRQVLKETAEDVAKTGNSIPNSREVIKNALQSKMNNLLVNYNNNTGVTIKCVINSVNPAFDPFEVEVNSSILAVKDNISYSRNNCHNVSILGLCSSKRFSGKLNQYYEIPDPLPFIKCKKYGGVKVKDGRIIYGSSLSSYLEDKINGSDVYENASSALYIRKCPYDPYMIHGNCKKYSTLKNCINNGYYHESSEGACILCRLEGKSICDHHGIETFIVPSRFTKKIVLRAPCSVDHVIFSEEYQGIYLGESVEYYSSAYFSLRIFLDNGHRMKYGLS